MSDINVSGNGHSPLVAESFGTVPAYEDLHELTVEELERLAMAEGIDLSQVRHQQRMAERMATARKHAPVNPSRLQKWSVTAGNFVLMLIMLGIRNFLMPLSIVGLAVAEFLRVRDGIRQFDPGNAGVLSFVAVGVYLGMLVVYTHNIDASKVTHYQWSFKMWRQNAVYVLGFGRNWQARKRTHENTLRSTISAGGMLIIFLGTYGSLHEELAKASTGDETLAWYEGLLHVITNTELDPFMAIVGGLLVTWSLLRGLEYVVAYNYNHFRQLVPETVDFLSVSSANTSEIEAEAKRQYLLYQIIQERQKRS